QCTEKELFVLKKIAHAADELNMPCYVIGGFVRDKLLGRCTKDADIVCVGDGILLAHKVAERFQPKPTVAYFKNFGTAQIKLKSSYSEHHHEQDSSPSIQVQQEGGSAVVEEEPHAASDFEIEFVGARKESYRYHSRNPEVLPGTLKDDQDRRDFTINAMA